MYVTGVYKESGGVMIVSWFSGGVSSAVATKLIIDSIDQIIYIDIDDQHTDSMRFLRDCEKWFDRKITILKSEYKSVENVVRSTRYINSPHGAPCTRLLKRDVRKTWEFDNLDLAKKAENVYIWGLDATETGRADRLTESNPDVIHRYPLIEQSISKKTAHEILSASGIKRPKMYDMGYNNNNCIGCVKGGAGYWNAIRIDFPEVFEARAKLERLIGATCLKGVYLDELRPTVGRPQRKIDNDCGLFCHDI